MCCVSLRRTSKSYGRGLPSDFHQHGLQTLITTPAGQNWELVWVDLSVFLGDEWEIHAGRKLDGRWLIRVRFATVDLQTVNAILVHGLGMPSAPRKLHNAATYMSRADDCPVPIAHHDIVRIVEAIRTRSISDPFLALLELLEEPKVPWYWLRVRSASPDGGRPRGITLGHVRVLIVI